MTSVWPGFVTLGHLRLRTLSAELGNTFFSDCCENIKQWHIQSYTIAKNTLRACEYLFISLGQPQRIGRTCHWDWRERVSRRDSLHLLWSILPRIGYSFQCLRLLRTWGNTHMRYWPVMCLHNSSFTWSFKMHQLFSFFCFFFCFNFVVIFVPVNSSGRAKLRHHLW